MKIYLDDLRTPVSEEWTVVRNPEDFKKVVEDSIKKGEEIEEISLDNDLGVPIEGWHLLRWIRDNYPTLLDAKIEFHTKNDVAKEEMRLTKEDWANHREDIITMSTNKEPHPWGNVEKVLKL